MEKYFNAALPNLSLPNNNREVYSNAVGDFANSGELERHLQNTINQIAQDGGLGGSFFQQLTPSGRLSAAKSFNTSTQITNATSAENHSKEKMPQRDVLFEVCTINQPLNASLRNQHSTGTYYFLK